MRLVDADALLAELDNTRFPGAPYVDAGISIAIGKVCDAPTIETERQEGEWILITDNNGQHFTCNRCGAWRYHQGQAFCSNCGARMKS